MTEAPPPKSKSAREQAGTPQEAKVKESAGSKPDITSPRGSAVGLSASNRADPPAPPPCEACSRPTNLYDAEAQVESHHALLAQKDAEIAALTAENERLREMLQSVIDHEDSVLWTRAERNRLSREARALLTEEGKP